MKINFYIWFEAGVQLYFTPGQLWHSQVKINHCFPLT